MKSPLEVACSHVNADKTNCGAAAGEPCRWEGPAPVELYHAERLEAAAACRGDAGEEAGKEEFDAAVAANLF